MPCIVLKNTNGSTRIIPSGHPYRLQPGEQIDGVDMQCGERIIEANHAPRIQYDTAPRLPTLAQELEEQIGGGFGDWIRFMATPIAEVMGKKGCTTCEARRIVTNAYGKLKEQHGQLRALSIIKDLWALSMKASGDEVLVKLNEVLKH